MINKERMIAISDGIIAVAATVMVLRLDIPEQVSMAAIAERIPTLIAYIISYIQIFLAWHEHHDALIKADRINHRIFLMNTLWLFFITMMPFITGVVGNSPNHTPTILLYILVLVLQSGTLMIECNMIERLNAIEIQDSPVIRLIRKITFIACLAAAILAFFAPIIAFGVIIGVSVASIIIICRYDRSVGTGD